MRNIRIATIVVNFLPKIRNNLVTAHHEREIHYLKNINDIFNDPGNDKKKVNDKTILCA